MIIPSLVGFLAGELVTGAKLTAHTKGAFDFLSGKPFCQLTGTLTVPNTTQQTVNWSGVVEDNDSMADTANKRIIIQTPGIYRVSVVVPWFNAGATGTRRQCLIYAGNVGAGAVVVENLSPSSAYAPIHFMSIYKRLNVGMEVHADIWQDSGSSQPTDTSTLTAEWISK